PDARRRARERRVREVDRAARQPQAGRAAPEVGRAQAGRRDAQIFLVDAGEQIGLELFLGREVRRDRDLAVEQRASIDEQGRAGRAGGLDQLRGARNVAERVRRAAAWADLAADLGEG